MPPRSNTPESGESPLLRWYAVAFGVFLGLAFLKFPNPPVLEHLAVAPNGIWEWLLTGWPVRYAYPLMGVLVLAGLWLVRWPSGVSSWLAWLPLLWLGWVGLSCAETLDKRLSALTMVHFLVCFVCFYLGLLVLSRVRQPAFLFAGVIGAFLLVMALGWEQHFGGLEASRQDYMLNVYPTLRVPPPPELLKRMEDGRIFSTMFYPNSLAGALLLLTPVLLGLIADAREWFTSGARWLLAAGVGAGSVACMVWSKSKGGWLLALGLAVVALFRLPVRRQWKIAIVAMLLVAGVAGFVVRYARFFKRGAPSVVQRINYWTAAGENIWAHPWLGSGPGTFLTVYQRFKPPEAEMTRLVHNDYLQQASDSGVPAAVLFIGIVGGVFWAGRWFWRNGSWTGFGVILGLAIFAIQSVLEFGFYIPATAWCWFALAGWLAGRSSLEFDKRPSPA